MRAIWFSCGMLAMALGFLGIPLPLLPTVPFLLLATFCFARSSPRLHEWLVNHPTYGPHIIAWQEQGAISLRAKRLATLTVALAFGISLFLGLAIHILIIQAVTLGLVMIFIWSRPVS